MKKEIELLTHENRQLNLKGAKLQETVNQRQEIFYMMQGKQNMVQKEEEKVDEAKGNMDIAYADNAGYKRAM